MVRRRWEIIEEELLKGIPGPYELEVTIEKLCICHHRNYMYLKWKIIPSLENWSLDSKPGSVVYQEFTGSVW